MRKATFSTKVKLTLSSPLDGRCSAGCRPGVCGTCPARRGLTFAGDPVEHNAIRAGAPGYVEVWPSLGATAVVEPEGRSPIDHAAAPAVIVAGTCGGDNRWLA